MPAAVPENGDPVSELEHLVEVVRHVQDRHALGLEAMDHLEEAPDVVTRERGGGLVEDEEAAFSSQPTSARGMATDVRCAGGKALIGALTSTSSRPRSASAWRVTGAPRASYRFPKPVR